MTKPNLSLSPDYPTSLRHSWLIWSCAALFYGYQFLLRVAPSVMTTELMADFQVDAAVLGLLTSFYYYAYAVFQVPVGSLLDKFGPRRLLTVAALLCTLGCLLFASSDSVMVACLGRFLIGTGSAFGFLSCMKLGTLWFPPQRIPMIIGLTLLLGTLGGMSGSYPMSFLVDGMGWRGATWATAMGGIFLAVLIVILVRDHPPRQLRDHIHDNHPHGDMTLSLREGFYAILRQGQTWLLAGYGFMMYVPLAGFADMWGVPFMVQVHHLDKQSASFATSCLYLGVGVGTPLFAYFSDRFHQFKTSLILSALGALAAFIIVVYVPELSRTTVTSLLFLIGLMSGGQFMAYAIVCKINPLSISGMATGFQNMVCLLSGVLAQPFIGWVLDLFWEGQFTNGSHAYSSAAFQMAMLSVIAALILAAFASFFVREVYQSHDL